MQCPARPDLKLILHLLWTCLWFPCLGNGWKLSLALAERGEEWGPKGHLALHPAPALAWWVTWGESFPVSGVCRETWLREEARWIPISGKH